MGRPPGSLNSFTKLEDVERTASIRHHAEDLRAKLESRAANRILYRDLRLDALHDMMAFFFLASVAMGIYLVVKNKFTMVFAKDYFRYLKLVIQQKFSNNEFLSVVGMYIFVFLCFVYATLITDRMKGLLVMAMSLVFVTLGHYVYFATAVNVPP